MPQGHLDEGTRIEIFLPFKKPEEIRAGTKVIDHIRKARTTRGWHRYWGMTHSVQMPTVFQGAWWDKKKGKWEIDNLVILTLDLEIDYSERAKVTQEAYELKKVVADFYDNAKAHQHEIWLIIHAIGRECTKLCTCP